MYRDMLRAWVGRRLGSGVTVLACVLAVACGRTSIEPCTWQTCEDAEGGSPPTGKGGKPALGGAGSSAGKASGGAGGSLGGAGGSLGGAGATSGGGGTGARAGEGGTAGAPFDPPTVLLLLDGSTSMYDRQVWVPTYEALTGPGGPLDRFQDRVRFGFTSYRGAGQSTEDDPACAVMTSVDFGLSNTPAIREAYQALSSLPRWPPWETPTGHALNRVLPALLAESESRKKYILLISDGAPDTCATTNPQCGQDRAVFAVQQAFRAGIQTRAIGIGFGNEYPGCTPDTGRCGSDHFQDVANAGRGLRVVAPPAGYRELPCIAETDGELLATYSEQGDSARFYWTQSPQDVASAVTKVLEEILQP
jgi:hypothetical protein